MSHQNNDQLFEQARDLIQYWEGTQHAKRMRWAMEQNDLDKLYLYVREAHEAMMMLEYGMDDEK